MIPGEVLPTGALPRTRLIPKASSTQSPRPQTRSRAKAVIAESHRVERQAHRQEWPHVVDPAEDKLIPGHVAYIRSRWGAVRHYRIRLVLTSKSTVNKGRRFFIGTDRKGLCHRVWVDQVVSIQTVQMALASGRAVRAIGRGR